jgi:hypothetical protein
MVGGRAGGCGYIKIKAQLSPVELNWGLPELGNSFTLFFQAEISSSNVYFKLDPLLLQFLPHSALS